MHIQFAAIFISDGYREILNKMDLNAFLSLQVLTVNLGIDFILMLYVCEALQCTWVCAEVFVITSALMNARTAFRLSRYMLHFTCILYMGVVVEYDNFGNSHAIAGFVFCRYIRHAMFGLFLKSLIKLKQYHCRILPVLV